MKIDKDERIAFVVFALIAAITILDGRKFIEAPDFVLNTMWTVGFVLIVQYFFRKRIGE